jgi:hypothetical protein
MRYHIISLIRKKKKNKQKLAIYLICYLGFMRCVSKDICYIHKKQESWKDKEKRADNDTDISCYRNFHRKEQLVDGIDASIKRGSYRSKEKIQFSLFLFLFCSLHFSIIHHVDLSV